MQYLAFCKDLNPCDQSVYKVEKRSQLNSHSAKKQHDIHSLAKAKAQLRGRPLL